MCINVGLFATLLLSVPQPQFQFAGLLCFFPAKNLQHLLFVTASQSAAFRWNLKSHSFQSAFTTSLLTQVHPDYHQKLALYISFTFIYLFTE